MTQYIVAYTQAIQLLRLNYILFIKHKEQKDPYELSDNE
jgi:hypothetical protein